MKLRTRLLLAYGYLAALVVIGASGAALGFHSLGARIGDFLDDNLERTRVSMALLEALEQQESAVLMALLKKEGARDDIEASERAFLSALRRATDEMTEEGEHALLLSIAGDIERYRIARDELLDSAEDSLLARYERECLPYLDPIKVGVRALLELNHQTMVRADREAQAVSDSRALGYAALAAFALMSLGYLSYNLERHVTSRLDNLRAVAEAVGRGDLRRRAAQEPVDELGYVARALNRLVDAHEALRSGSDARQAVLRDSVAALVATLEPPAALVDLAGDLVTSSLGDAIDRRIETTAPGVTSGTAHRGGAAEVSADGVTLRYRLLVGPGGRPVGWLVRPG